MPDLALQAYWHCVTAEHFSMKVQGTTDTYTVTWGPSPFGPYQYDYACTCRSYRFGKGKHCKHIDEVKKSGKHCKWMQFTDGGEPANQNGKLVCPNCGSDINSQMYGV